MAFAGGDLDYIAELNALRPPLTANLNVYVNGNTGSDSNSGLSAITAWATINYAVSYVIAHYDFAGYDVTINIADATYAQAVGVPPLAINSGSLRILGNVTTPANVLIAPATGDALYVQASSVYIAGVKLMSVDGNGLLTDQGAQVYLNGNNTFGGAGASHAQIHAYLGSSIIIQNSYTIAGNAGAHLRAGVGGRVEVRGAATATLSGTPAFSTAFAYAHDLGVIRSAGTYSGGGTGVRYSAVANGVVETFGGGASFFPGNSGGSTATGGQYV